MMIDMIMDKKILEYLTISFTVLVKKKKGICIIVQNMFFHEEILETPQF